MRKLEVVLTVDDEVELRDLATEIVLWTSNGDADFLEDFPDEVLTEEDLPHIVDWLLDGELITEAEADHFESDGVIVEDSDGEDESDEDEPDDDDEEE